MGKGWDHAHNFADGKSRVEQVLLPAVVQTGMRRERTVACVCVSARLFVCVCVCVSARVKLFEDDGQLGQGQFLESMAAGKLVDETLGSRHLRRGWGELKVGFGRRGGIDGSGKKCRRWSVRKG